MQNNKTTYLTWYDLCVLTLIFFGEAIYTSTLQYFITTEMQGNFEENLTFSNEQNYWALLTQLALLLIAMGYLKWRNFDFSRWVIRPSWQAFLSGIGLFILLSLAMDLYFEVLYGVYNLVYPEPFLAVLGEVNISTVLYAILNGFYEEIFFLGICLAVKPEYLKWAVIYSLIIRVSFHTYQGMESALGLGIWLGLIIYLLYSRSKDKNLLPFWVAHSIADILGLSLLAYF
ncbi:CPBP family intramembrane glutamic endopeptidase [Mannheimia haemolytica]|uniref:CPBP family intramembrane glutamic endopeptidase n=1 Tax=Mannheimia haemolytica TaxID=75985 RepID=UPI001CF4D9F4|nr:CPBP family intramembrane glutamic endopeptidase [Mannheimia haemolytica]MCB4227674.1 CPBP family intramembrane metalloprotease [Mannheimia haemolytica]